MATSRLRHSSLGVKPAEVINKNIVMNFLYTHKYSSKVYIKGIIMLSWDTRLPSSLVCLMVASVQNIWNRSWRCGAMYEGTSGRIAVTTNTPLHKTTMSRLVCG